jgi:6,7-dimethyl-8-ribityllumazine synthase
MGQTYSGSYRGADLRIVIIASRWNELVVGRLVDGATDTLIRHGTEEKEIDIVYVPGAFELAPLAARLVGMNRYDAIICLGAVIRGATPHFEYVAGATARGIASVSLESGTPVLFGVLTCDNLEQALERAGSKAGNKGSEAAMAALEMCDLYRILEAG